MTVDQSRLLRQQEVMRLRAQLAGDHAPDPPYQVRGVDMIYLMCQFSPQAVARVLPPGLTPSKSCWGPIAVYSVESGWGIGPFSAFFMAVEVEGYDSPDGSLAMYMHSGLYSDLGGEVMSTRYNTNFRIGSSRQWTEGSSVFGEGRYNDQPVVRFSADPLPVAPTALNGIHRYIGRRSDGGLNIYSVAFTGDFQQVAPRSVEFLKGAETVINVLEPIEFVWPTMIRGMSMTFSEPRRLEDNAIDASTAESRIGLLDLFGRMGRAAAIVDREARVLQLNAGAERLAASVAIPIRKGYLGGHAQSAGPMGEILLSAAKGGAEAVSPRFALHGQGADHTIIAQAMALGPEDFVVFFDDPTHEDASDPVPALQLFGLTPAEARVAAAVGGGRSPRDAATALGLTLNTVRSALKIAFDKLGISRQSELARIVARLAG